MQTIETTDTADLIANYEAQAEAALKLTAAEVAARIRPYVAEMTIPSLPGITFSISEAGIYLSHGYWRVIVHPSRDPKRAMLFADALGDLEDRLRECEKFLVTIEPGDPLTEE